MSHIFQRFPHFQQQGLKHTKIFILHAGLYKDLIHYADGDTKIYFKINIFS